jgi:hypothetical protein
MEQSADPAALTAAVDWNEWRLTGGTPAALFGHILPLVSPVLTSLSRVTPSAASEQLMSQEVV